MRRILTAAERVAVWHLSTHPPLSAKDSCQACWQESAERGGERPYLDLLRERHGEELAEHFGRDRYLQQQRQMARPGRGRAAGYADEHPELFPYEHLEPGEDPFANRPHFERHPIDPEHADPGDEGDVYWGDKKYHSVARKGQAR